MAAARGRKILWITETPSSLHKERGTQLAKIGYAVQFVRGVKEFEAECARARPGTIILDTMSQPAETVQFISHMSQAAELRAARFILSLIHQDPAASQIAMSANFRDLIPWDLDSSNWLSRFQYAASANFTESSVNVGELTMNVPATIRMPGKLIWMNESHVRLECRGQFQAGTALHLGGSVASALGVPHISLIVEGTFNDHLHYRFSQAVVAQWNVPSLQAERARALIRRIAVDQPRSRVRAFLAIQNAAIRRTVVDQLTVQRCDINVAMHRSNIHAELTYFSPDIVILDDGLVTNLTDYEIQQMMTHTEDQVPLLVYGSDFEDHRLRHLLPKRRIYCEMEPNRDNLKNPLQVYNIQPVSPDLMLTEKCLYFASTHAWTNVELEIVARIRSMGPRGGSLALPFPLGHFTLAKLESPILKRSLGRPVFLKMTTFRELISGNLETQLTCEGQFKISDLNQEETKRLARTLLTTAADHYAKSFQLDHETKSLPTPDKLVVSQPMVASSSASLPARAPERPMEKETLALPDLSYPEESPKPVNALQELPDPPSSNKNLSRDTPRELKSSAFDPVLAKAIGLFFVAASIMGFIIYAATHVDESAYKDHGKQYSEFFKRMKDPDYRSPNTIEPTP